MKLQNRTLLAQGPALLVIGVLWWSVIMLGLLAVVGWVLKKATHHHALAGVTFAPVDVTQDDVAPLNRRYGVIQDPAILVLRPPGDLVVRIDGFADRDTVAQAAANAAQ